MILSGGTTKDLFEGGSGGALATRIAGWEATTVLRSDSQLVSWTWPLEMVGLLILGCIGAVLALCVFVVFDTTW